MTDPTLEELRKRHGVVTRTRAEAQGALKATQADLKALIEEIRAAGFDPATLRQDLEAAEGALREKMALFAEQLALAEAALGITPPGETKR